MGRKGVLYIEQQKKNPQNSKKSALYCQMKTNPVQ
jgi:hypothetical protein